VQITAQVQQVAIVYRDVRPSGSFTLVARGLGILDRLIRYNGGGLPSDHHDPGYNYTLPYPKRPGHALVMLCLWGVAGACLIADTGYELYAAWETVKDLDQLYVDLGMTDVT
jgi:hypothetical protein